jgi:hypothetical protein
VRSSEALPSPTTAPEAGVGIRIWFCPPTAPRFPSFRAAAGHTRNSTERRNLRLEYRPRLADLPRRHEPALMTERSHANRRNRQEPRRTFVEDSVVQGASVSLTS